MIVSILQMMGFGAGLAQAKNAREDSEGKPQAASGKKPVPVKAASKTASKAAATTASKVTSKAKVPAKAAVKAAVKASPTKPIAKPAAKPAAKSMATQPAAKPVTKAVAKAAPVKSAPKSPAKPVVKPAVATKVAVKAAAKPPVKAPAKVATKMQPSPAPKTKASPAVPDNPAPSRAIASKPTPAVTVAVATGAPAAKPVATRAARGSRLAQLTVPSMAQAVASTAAKASYTQIMSTASVAPPPHMVPKKDPKLANNWKTKPLTELTDADVLAMSDDDYMNDVQMAYFRVKLVKLKQDILNSAGETTEHLREDTVIVPDPADRATIEEEHALELRTRDRERKLLKKIEQSINRIDSGDYGYCDETGEPIGVGRLLARPTASLSLEAQQRRELKQKMFGD